MSQHAYELCNLLVHDTYGELTSRIFEVLLCHGRLSLPALIHCTKLRRRLVKYGLSVLVQQHLILWYTSPDEHMTLYEANTAVAYSLVRSGKYVKIAEAEAGHFAGKVISNLLLLGHARVGDLARAYRVVPYKTTNDGSAATQGQSGKVKSRTSNYAEGVVEEPNDTPGSIHGTLCNLLRSGLVSQVHISHFRSDADNRSEAGNAVPKAEEYKAKNKKEQEAQHEVAIKKKLKEWKYFTGGNDQTGDLKEGKKRLHQDIETQRPEKRQRLSSSVTQEVNEATGGVYQPMLDATGGLDTNLIIRVNHAKFAVLMRNDQLVDFAGRIISTSTARVYAQVLRELQPEIRDCREEPENLNEPDAETNVISSPQVSTAELVYAIKDSPELASALGNADDRRLDMAQFDHPKKRRKKESSGEGGLVLDNKINLDELDEVDVSNSSEEENISDLSSDPEEVDGETGYDPSTLHNQLRGSHRDTIRNHLLVLALHPLSFLHRLPKTPVLPERWTVHYPTLMKNVAHHILLETITSRHGLPAARLTRILCDKGRTDEKVLCSISLLPQKTMRSYLLPLHKAGMIGLQEVPRDNSRNPQRTNFLWFFDPERCKAKIVEETYKSMARCLGRANLEGEKVKGTREKASRSDVIGREKEFLGVQELEAIEAWKQIDDGIWREIFRLDDLIACLRDF